MSVVRPSELLLKYADHTVTLTIIDGKGVERGRVMALTLANAIALAKAQPERVFDIIIHTQEGDLALKGDIVAALLA